MKVKPKFRLNSWQIITLGYLIVILTGSFLLSLPFSNKASMWTPYINALFTATSATCVTGLIVYDTFTHWTLFGQIVILLMIQIGGIGFMTLVTLFGMMMKRKIGLYERKILMDSAGSLQTYGVVRLIKRILIGTLIIEGVGALLLMIRFIPVFGVANGIYYGIFHSVSAFCNAGFDLMGRNAPFSSLTYFSSDVVVNITIMSLIIIGGLGFFVWNDIIEEKGKFKRFQLYTKIVLIATFVMITISALLFYLFECNNILDGKSAGEKILISLFSVITPRTAGFNTVQIASLSDSSKFLTMFLMLVGGSSGSTAGGIKITTFAVLLFGVIASARNDDAITIGNKRLEQSAGNRALAVLISYLTIVCVGITIITVVEDYSLTDIAIEVISAVCTVGLTVGITPYLGVISKLVLIFAMFAGRVGVLNLVLAFSEKKENPPVKKPVDKILIG